MRGGNTALLRNILKAYSGLKSAFRIEGLFKEKGGSAYSFKHRRTTDVVKNGVCRSFFKKNSRKKTKYYRKIVYK